MIGGGSFREHSAVEKKSQYFKRNLVLGFSLAVALVEELLNQRGTASAAWPRCAQCGGPIESKGLLERQLKTIIGLICWKRRVGRCAQGCSLPQIVPADEALGLQPYQETCWSLQRMACLLAVFLPFETASLMLRALLGLSISPMSIWHWTQASGQEAMEQLTQQLNALQAGNLPLQERLSEEWKQLDLLIGADGVMVPFRPFPQTPTGKTKWREVKVGILARLQQVATRAGNVFARLKQRRVVAVLGDTLQLKSRLILESWTQRVTEAPHVVWLSDGARGLWNVYTFGFSLYAIGILDFFHASQNLWKAAAAWRDGRTKKARQWFKEARHRLRHGQLDAVMLEISQAAQAPHLSQATRKTLLQVLQYLQKNQPHMDYTYFKELGLPLGSGFVESTCKWLIQQRFKGVGMRWSEEGFNHLLHLRLAWVNQRFSLCFPT